MTQAVSPRISVTQLGWFAYLAAALVIAADQASKAWILYGLRLPERGAVTLLPVLRLNLTWNPGFSFGLLANVELARWGLFVFSIGVAIGLAVWARRMQRAWPALALGLIMGGAIGNAVDRVRFGAVVDFIDVSGLKVFPWIFNVADSAITIGGVLLLLDSLFARNDVPS